jgi:hypothetical protein
MGFVRIRKEREVVSVAKRKGRRRRRLLPCGPALPVREAGRGPVVSRREKEARALGRERKLGRARGERGKLGLRPGRLPFSFFFPISNFFSVLFYSFF